ncbi:sugar phosphate isomerase/epimerase family protein [Paenibacillaceae bacterium WGS1546]|uniref:sugar phosphate isomerase/epimerase family protein n=1 Tax=Cohnella sp. WGS1546 TaxID=3366810 RepID=UPI00372D2A43
MKLGIFAKTFVRPSLEQTLDAVRDNGLDVVQFNMSCAGMSSMPARLDPEIASRVGKESKARGITIAAVSGTFNMAHPERRVRQEGVARLDHLAGMCKAMGTGVITLCTGSRDPDNMWRRHPDNRSAQAWNDMVSTMEAALLVAERHGIDLAIEPEASNVVSDAKRAKALLDLMQSDRLKIVMDAANLFEPAKLARMKPVMDEAFELLGSRIIVAHAKDVAADEELAFTAAGLGALDYDYYISLLRQVSFQGPLILHGLEQSQVPASVDFLRKRLGE